MNDVPMNKWITTADELPDDEQTVLIATAEGEVWIGYHEDDTWMDVSCMPFGPGKATHWMDLPAAPNAELRGRPLADGPA